MTHNANQRSGKYLSKQRWGSLNDIEKKLLCENLIAHIHVHASNLTKLVTYLYLMNVGMQ